MGKKFIGLAVILGMALILSGCANNGPQGGHTKKWYEQHTSARHAENNWCAKQHAAIQLHSRSCLEAGNAAFRVETKRSVANLGPIPTQLKDGSGPPMPAS